MAMEEGLNWVFEDYLRNPGLVPCNWNRSTRNGGRHLSDLDLEELQEEVGLALVPKISVFAPGTRVDSTKRVLEKEALMAQLGPVLLALQVKRQSNEQRQQLAQTQQQLAQTQQQLTRTQLALDVASEAEGLVRTLERKLEELTK